MGFYSCLLFPTVRAATMDLPVAEPQDMYSQALPGSIGAATMDLLGASHFCKYIRRGEAFRQ